ncbi:MAG: HypC/HybG/HupF family hydrogenase formation chaperone [Clostridiales bacterium]|jgi:hydrogenase expression/formation protein HypC|nr:HypC/HybG/HupF family hydrogenase formation chaperone [Eubacteriales bacterium]MDH7564915.1 HypC/HybG/HupF family hydrogenase formation chaperone [Clostridiales bacterium]
MCLGLPGKVLSVDGKNGLVEILGVTREISLELLRRVKPGDYVLIHAGSAIEVIDEEEAQNTIQLFQELKEISNG